MADGAPPGDRPRSGPGQDFGFNRRGMPKSMSGPSATFMPPHILAMFKPRDPLPFLPLPVEKTQAPSRLTGIAALTSEFERGPPPPVQRGETPAARKERIRSERAAKHKASLEEKAAKYAPFDNPKATGDAYRTLFVARLAYETTERKLQREFEAFGPIESVRIVKHASSGQPRGYAFIEFRSEDDLKRAYRRGDGLLIDGRRVLVDVERGRTVRGWRPRSLGGGLGDTRKDKKPKRAEKRGGPGWVRPPIGMHAVLLTLAQKEEAAAAKKAGAGAPPGRGEDESMGRGPR